MATVMKASEFIEKLNDVVNNYKTLYVMGCFGSPMNTKNKTRYCNNHEYNKQTKRTQFIQAASTDTFGFDCVNMIKAILWGWTGDKTKTYGGAKYASNGVPDIGADAMIKKCIDVSTDFTELVPGEALWTNGHIGVYIGNGLAIECTPAWKNKVQITAVKNMGVKSGYNNRVWKKHGKLPYITYDVTDTYKKVETKTEGVCDVDVKMLKKGSKGDAVKSLQILLIGYGYACGSAGADGDFGAGTYKAVRAYQKANGLTVDGSVGPTTWSKLLGVK